MELLKDILPNDIVSKIRMYHSHPISDIMKTWIDTYELQVRTCGVTRTFSDDYFEWFNGINQRHTGWQSDDEDYYDPDRDW